MKDIVLVIIGGILFGNSIFRFLQLFIQVKKLTYSSDVKHLFTCSICHQDNVYSGDKLKENMKRVQDTVTVNGYTKTMYMVRCHYCQTFTQQAKTYDEKIHRRSMTPISFYNLDYKMDDYAKSAFKSFVLKGLLPIPFLCLLFFLVAVFM